MSIKIILALILTPICIILSEVGVQIVGTYFQILLYVAIIALIGSRYMEER